MRIKTTALYKHAYGKFATGAYNICSLEQLHGLFRGAQKSGAPIIAALTKVARDYAHPKILAAMLKAVDAISLPRSLGEHFFVELKVALIMLQDLVG